MDGRDGTERLAVERWFLRQGLPHLIDDYRASTDVFTRAIPFLVLVFLFNVRRGSFGDRFTGWSQAGVALLSALIIIGSCRAGMNLLRGRRALQLPDEVGPVELGVFTFVPVVPRPPVRRVSRWSRVAGIVVFNLVVLAVVYLVVGYGLVPTTVWAASARPGVT